MKPISLPRRQSLIVLLILMLFVIGCVRDRSEIVVVRPICPPLVEYSAKTQREAISEVKALDPDSVLARMVKDYAAMRDAARACRAKLDTLEKKSQT